jgi:hypothetical protein
VWVGSEFAPPAPGHDPLETMTEQAYDSKITLSERGKEVIRIDQEGFHYKGEFIADAGEAHRLMVAFLKQNTHQPEEIASEENKRRLKACLEQIRNLTHSDLVKLMGEECIEDYRRQFF